MKAQLVIRGAYYRSGNEILVPHFTGEYYIVDCDRFLTKKNLLETYGKQYFNENKDNYVTVDGVKYYYAEYSTYNITEYWELLSDLSELSHTEESFDF